MRMLAKLARAGTLAWVVVLLAACGDTKLPSQPEPEPEEPDPEVSAVVIEQTPADSLIVEHVAPDSLAARVDDQSGNPVEGVLVNFETEPDGCADPDASALTTNANGRAFFEVTAGSDAWTSTGEPCVLKTVQSEDGRAALADSATMWVEPGPPTTVIRGGWTKTSTGSIALPADWIVDEHGNPALWQLKVDAFAHPAGTDPGTEAARTLIADSAGTTDLCATVADTAVLAMGLEVDESNHLTVNTRDDLQGCR